MTTITTVKTVDGREIGIDTLRTLFDKVCNEIKAVDSEWTWKEQVWYEDVFTTADQVNDMISAIQFFVGGPTKVAMFKENEVQKYELLNKGYYANIGA